MTEEEYKALCDFDKTIKSCTNEELVNWLLPEVVVQEFLEEQHNENSVERII